jgi:hypothetical protein
VPFQAAKGKEMKKNFKFFGVLLMALWGGLVVPPAMAQQGSTIGLRMDVDKRQLEVGDHLTVSIEFKQIGSGNSATGEPSISTPEHFEIQGQSSATQVTIVNQQEAMVSTTRLSLVATKAGDETLGPALLIYQDPQGQKHEIHSNVVSVTVVEKTGFSLFGKKKADPTPTPEATPDESDAPRDVKPLMNDSYMGLRILFWLVVAALVAGFVWWQFRKKGPADKAPAVPLGKAAELRENWKKLSNEDLSSTEFCLGLSSLVRECLQYRFNFPAVDCTTEEILRSLKQLKISDDAFVAAEKCLKTCDRVLYADGNLTGRENLRALCSALLPKASKN